jgi:hypothetical protein
MLVDVTHEYYPDRGWGLLVCSREKESLRVSGKANCHLVSLLLGVLFQAPKACLDVPSGPRFFVAPAHFWCILCGVVR